MHADSSQAHGGIFLTAPPLPPAGKYITWALAVTMLGMGLTLDADDFSEAVRAPST